MLSISQAARYIGVSLPTLRRWDRNQILPAIRTPGNHRRYSFDQLQRFYVSNNEDESEPESKKVIYAYARVSGAHQKVSGNLDRQCQQILKYMRKKYGSNSVKSHVMIKENGSGLNPNRPGLKRLLRDVQNGKVNRVIILYKDRLTRFGFPFLERICDLHGVPITEVEPLAKESLEYQLMTDMMSLMAVFSGKLFKSRALRLTAEERELKKIQTAIEGQLDWAISKAVKTAIKSELVSLCP